MNINRKILDIYNEINKSQKSILQSIRLNEGVTFSPPLDRLVVTSPFGPRRGSNHGGVDLAANAERVKSPADGEVTYAATDENACGGTIIIKHADGYTTGYCHMQKINVKIGETVKKGKVIGISGGGIGDYGRGRSEGRHLHFTVKKNGVLVDPMNYLDEKNANLISPAVDSSTKTNSIIDDLYNDQDEIEFGGYIKNIKENIERIKKIL
jgi:murein DD-endopeptidase MepM/ murein hydrolase activator NlpD